jgi:hypothetical protein
MIAPTGIVAHLLMAAALASPQALPTLDPYAIYKAAMRELATLPQPAFIDDTEHWNSIQFSDTDTTATEEHFQRVIFDSGERRECILRVPYTPRDPVDISSSYFAPDTWLISRRLGPAAASGGPNMSPDLSDLKTIANVVSVTKPSYEVRLAGIDAMTHGGTAYHLILHPKSNPVLHNLRELWINTATSDIMRAIIYGAYRPTNSDTLQDTYVIEDFGRIGPYWLALHHVWTYAIPFTNIHYQYNVTSVTMRFPATVPAWFFNERLFRQHLDDVTQALNDL